MADMANIMRKELQEIGYKVNVPDNRELMMYYFTTGGNMGTGPCFTENRSD